MMVPGIIFVAPCAGLPWAKNMPAKNMSATEIKNIRFMVLFSINPLWNFNSVQ
jgi:hypothetical protein